MTAGSRGPATRIARRRPREQHRPAAVPVRAPGTAQAPHAGLAARERCRRVSRQPGHGGAGEPAATRADPAAGPGAAFPDPRAITGTAAQPQPRQAGPAVAVVLARAARLTAQSPRGTRRRYRPGTAPASSGGTRRGRRRAAALDRDGFCVLAGRGRAARHRPCAAARSRAFGLPPGAGG